jgi:F-type H+-transporting ATPase subunit b
MAHPLLGQLALAAIMLASHPALAATPEAEAGGLPQMDTTTYTSQLFWLFVCFAALYLLMARLALPQTAKVLANRQQRVEGDLSAAQNLKDEADKVKSAYEKDLAKAQDAAAAATAAAERSISEKIAEEQSRFTEASRKRLAAAEQNINKAKAEALQSLADIAAEIAAEMASKVADVQSNKTEAKKAVLSVMQKG